MAGEHHVNLVRDALSTPWGFRMQGGKDYKAPLCITRVAIGSPADSCVRRGDVITRLEKQDARNMTHRHAMNIVLQSGGSLFMTIVRGQSAPTKPYRERPASALGRPGSMFDKVAHSLERNVFSPVGGPQYINPSGDEWEPHRSVRDLKHQFGSRPNVVNARGPTYQEPRGMQQDTGNPAWAGSLRNSTGPRQFELAAAEGIAPGSVPPGQPRGGPAGYQAPQGQQFAPVHGGTGVTPHQPRVQNVHTGPQGQTYSQHNPDSHPQSDTATVQHLQYNNPIGLYSRSNVDEALRSQTGGRPGDGTMKVSGGGKKEFDPSQSSVLAYLQGEERGQRRGHQSARMYDHQDHAQAWMGCQNTRVQSPSMNRLEEQFGGDMSEGPGTSDF